MHPTTLLIAATLACLLSLDVIAAEHAERVVIESDGWELIGDLQVPGSDDAAAAVLLLNQAAGDRMPYEDVAAELFQRGIASLRLDLRGHGESTNLGSFNPEQITDEDRELMIRQAHADVVAAHRFLAGHPSVDASRIAIVGASYSGEEMAEAGRSSAFARAYVALSPGSFSDESIAAMDGSGAAWLFIVSKYERYLVDIVANVHEKTRTVELLYLPGEQHATDILDDRADIAERIAVWLDTVLRE